MFANEYANANYPDKHPESHRQSVPLHCWLCLHLPPARRQQSLDRLESKIVFLTLWIISIIAISVWLIVVEFIHNKLEEQQKIAGMSFDEMLEKFRGKEEE